MSIRNELSLARLKHERIASIDLHRRGIFQMAFAFGDQRHFDKPRASSSRDVDERASAPNKERSLRKLNNLSRVFARKPNGLGLNLNLLCSVSFFIFFVSFFCLLPHFSSTRANSKDCSYKKCFFFLLYFVSFVCFLPLRWIHSAKKKKETHERMGKKKNVQNYGFASRLLPELCSWFAGLFGLERAMRNICHIFNN